MELSEIRVKIDEIDSKLLKLFSERMGLSEKVAEYKIQNNMPVFDQTREKAIIEKLTDGLGEREKNNVAMLYSRIFEISRARQYTLLSNGNKELKNLIEFAKQNTPESLPEGEMVCCQGVEGAYSSKACESLFENPKIQYTPSFEDVFESVISGKCRYGILPIENSLFGSVVQVYDLMAKFRHQFYIVKSVKLPINHTLVAKKGANLENVTKVYSHPQAIGQCSEFLKKNSKIEVIPCENTAVAAKFVCDSKSSDIAAISSKECADIYNLEILENNIQNNDNNFTRFICISKNLEIYKGSARVGMMFTLRHEVGSLNEMLSRFAFLGLNLTKLESRPIPGKDFEFMFYAETDADSLSDQVIAFFEELSQRKEEFIFLGCYNEK